jgi:hypothetical protein
MRYTDFNSRRYSKRLKLVGMKQFEDAVMRTMVGIEKKRSLLSAVGRCRLTL